MNAGLCVCGHSRKPHTNHRRGTDCSICGISCLRYRPAHSRGMAVALAVVAAFLLAAGVAFVIAVLMNGWGLLAVGALIAFGAVSNFYRARAFDTFDRVTADIRAAAAQDHAAEVRERAARALAQQRHPSAGPDEWDTAIIRLIDDHRGAA